MKIREKTWSEKEFRRKLERNGYHLNRRNGSHLVFQNTSGRIIVMTTRINKMVARRLIKEYGLTK